MKRSALALLILACLCACDGGSGSGSGSSSMTMPPPTATSAPPAMSVDFTNFTKEVMAIQSDRALPVVVTQAEFRFPDDDNPQAFASVLTGP